MDDPSRINTYKTEFLKEVARGVEDAGRPLEIRVAAAAIESGWQFERNWLRLTLSGQEVADLKLRARTGELAGFDLKGRSWAEADIGAIDNSARKIAESTKEKPIIVVGRQGPKPSTLPEEVAEGAPVYYIDIG